MSTRSRYLTASEAAEYSRYSPKTLANLRSLGMGPAYLRVGRSIRYTEASLDRWIQGDASDGAA